MSLMSKIFSKAAKNKLKIESLKKELLKNEIFRLVTKLYEMDSLIDLIDEEKRTDSMCAFQAHFRNYKECRFFYPGDFEKSQVFLDLAGVEYRCFYAHINDWKCDIIFNKGGYEYKYKDFKEQDMNKDPSIRINAKDFKDSHPNLRRAFSHIEKDLDL